MKRAIALILYASALVVFIKWSVSYNELLSHIYARNLHALGMLVFAALYPVIIGLFIAVPGLLSAITKHGAWKINWLRLIIVGVPTALITFSQILYFYTPLSTIINPGAVSSLSSSILPAGIVLGYTLLSAPEKSEILSMSSDISGIKTTLEEHSQILKALEQSGAAKNQEQLRNDIAQIKG